MDKKKFLNALGFKPKENTSGVYCKNYLQFNSYLIEIDLENKHFNFGDKINVESQATQNFSQAENWVVLECVNRLLEKGYPPQNITLEKTWATGHGTSGRLDILVTRDSGSAYLMIECKTWGDEFDKEFKNLEKDGGQLFTYFQQDKDADVIMLYASELESNELKYRNEIVKIEKDYRQTGNVKDFYERWNKLPKSNGVFDNWCTPYNFKSKALTKNDLKELKHEDSSFIFKRFLEILRHNVVSDKPNAFNKIFTLFLCKIVDEDRNKDGELHFQWLEGQDDHISFQKRLTDIYKRGMQELLEKKVSDISDSEFDTRFQQVEEKYRNEIKNILTEIRLKKNNEFAIKEVYDDASFIENAKVVKEVVELLQVYQIRYNYRQQFLSDFFELLLTTGLKQESGQFFTPVPIARFIIKSLPLQKIANSKIQMGNTNDLLPTVIDYAAGSGHFVTESMEEIQKYIDNLDLNLDDSKFNPTSKRSIKKWKEDQFDWAEKYVYAIEKDYRLVKTTKVSCYLHGDGLAKVIHGDGLGDFATATEFKDLLKDTDRTYSQDNKQFDIVISNPPYSVSAFKGLMDEQKSTKGFDLYKRLTDQSSEIECLFIERTKQLLKDGGVAGIILPSSILSNAGIYTQTREIILKYFDVLGIVELGSNTFMATGTNTVVLFLKRRNNADAFNIKESIKKLFINQRDVTINGIENPLQKYIAHVWKNITFADYKTLFQKSPNDTIKNHEIYQEYDKKLKKKNEPEQWKHVLVFEQEKLLYFILTLPQKIVLIKTGEKNKEKAFLGYEFSNRRGSEGIHPINRGRTIDKCTQLYDADTFENPEKASTYIYKAFNGEFDLALPENLQKNVSYQNLVDMLTFDRVDFEKNISLSIKKKVKSRWNLVRLGEICDVRDGTHESPQFVTKGYPLITSKNLINDRIDFTNVNYISKKDFDDINKRSLVESGDILFAMIGTIGFPTIVLSDNQFAIKNVALFKYDKSGILNNIYLKELLNFHLVKEQIAFESKGSNRKFVSLTILRNLKIPLPPINIQEKIVAEIEFLEKQEQKAVEDAKQLKEKIKKKFLNIISKSNSKVRLSDNEFFDISIGKRVLRRDVKKNGEIPIFSANVFEPFGYIDKHLVSDYNVPSILWGIDGDWMVRYFPKNKPFYPTDHCGVLRVKNNIINERILAYILEQEGDILEFSRNKRASMDRIQGIKIPLPPLKEQKQTVAEIEKIEKKIADLEKEIEMIPKQKELILKKYLE